MIDQRSFVGAMAGTIVGGGLSGSAAIAQEAPSSPPRACGIAEPARTQIVERDRRPLLRTVDLFVESSESSWANSSTKHADAIAAIVREMKAAAFNGVRAASLGRQPFLPIISIGRTATT